MPVQNTPRVQPKRLAAGIGAARLPRNAATPFTGAGDQIRWLDVPAVPRTRTRPPRIYVHGLVGTGAAAFGNFAPHPLVAGPRSIVVDLPGHGLSDRPADFGYTLDDHAAAIATVLDAVRLRGVDLVGQSMGGSIGIVRAARRPELVGHLVLAEANLDPLRRRPPASAASGWRARPRPTGMATGYDRLMTSEPGWAPTLRLCDPLAAHRSAVSLILGRRLVEPVSSASWLT